jgi:hypothetical protein
MGKSKIFVLPDYDLELVTAKTSVEELEEEGVFLDPAEILYDPDDPESRERYLLRAGFIPSSIVETMKETFPDYEPFSGFGGVSELREYLMDIHKNRKIVKEYIDGISHLLCPQ